MCKASSLHGQNSEQQENLCHHSFSIHQVKASVACQIIGFYFRSPLLDERLVFVWFQAGLQLMWMCFAVQAISCPVRRW